MAHEPSAFILESKPRQRLPVPKIKLTLTQAAAGQLEIGVSITEFIAYSQNTGFTQLNLRGGRVLDVKETTDQIDRLLRLASNQHIPNFLVDYP